jgi:hypothetical protein
MTRHETPHEMDTKLIPVGAKGTAKMAEIAKLKAELEALNLQCQLARDHEIRYALQRTRLETARMQIMLKIVDTVSAPPEAPPSSPYHVVMHEPSSAPVIVRELPPTNGVKAANPPPRQKRKPDGTLSWSKMCLAVLDGEDTPEAGMRPREVTRIIRQIWRPDAKPGRVNATLWKLATEGRLENNDGRYRLNGHADE